MQRTSKLSQPIVNVNRLLVLCLLCLALPFLNGCGGSQNPSALVGKWEADGGVKPAGENVPPFSMVLLKNGTGTMNKENIAVTWKVDGDYLILNFASYLTGQPMTDTWKYKQSGSALTFPGLQGENLATYKKVK